MYPSIVSKSAQLPGGDGSPTTGKPNTSYLSNIFLGYSRGAFSRWNEKYFIISIKDRQFARRIYG
ncbi:hypothetical protein C5167_026721 [Papaver somniferum]|nr:hypothetical protein C5167_026721 [Papaver somniferum]